MRRIVRSENFETLRVPVTKYMEVSKKIEDARKGSAFLVYAINSELGVYRTVRYWAKAWGVSVGGAHKWSQEFERILEDLDLADEMLIR